MTPWARATLALRLLAADPAGLGGIWLRARSGPVRERFVAALGALPLPLRKIHTGIADEQLYGGVDLSATLNSGKVVWQRGLFATPTVFVLPMAERCAPGLAARLANALEEGRGHCLIALDEGAEPGEALPHALCERLALHLDLDGVGFGETEPLLQTPVPVERPIANVTAPAQALQDLAAIALRLGIDSLRAPLHALRAAKAHAALAGRAEVGTEDLAVAAALVLGPRATHAPAEDPPPEPNDPPDAQPEADPPQDEAGGDTDSAQRTPPDDILLEAAAATLPRDLLESLAAGRAPRSQAGSSGTGAGKKGNRRGRPLPARPGKINGQSRVDMIATLRAAAPWQPLRRASACGGPTAERTLHVRLPDIRTKRYQEQSDRLLIFVVDASGSAAMSRLAEAKGAVELLLGEAYARRDHVALVAFRGTGAEVLLPPTRSLVQTKRRLAALPGGGGTPLAAGLSAAMELARAAQGRGMTPTLALLTDGRANIALDGSADRKAAADDAAHVARTIRSARFPGLVIDVSPRPQPALNTLAAEMGAPYLAMPRADAARLSTAVTATLDA
ncbi:MAG: magnesium chelatase subunit D [Pseudomonadota bacterium]